MDNSLQQHGVVSSCTFIYNSPSAFPKHTHISLSLPLSLSNNYIMPHVHACLSCCAANQASPTIRRLADPLSIIFLGHGNLAPPWLQLSHIWKANRKPHASCRMVPVWMSLSDFWPIFQGHDIIQRQITQKLHKIELYWQWWTNRKSYMVYRTAPVWQFQWSWTTPNPVFKVTLYFDDEDLING